MTIKEIVSATGLTQKKVAELLGCSYRTVQEWAGERRKCPEWVKRLIIYYLVHEGYIQPYIQPEEK
jgi:DNA-binding transcriptional regulator YiaG